MVAVSPQTGSLVSSKLLRSADCRVIQQHGGVLEFEAEPAGEHHGPTLVAERVTRYAVRDVEGEGQCVSGRGEFFPGGEWLQQEQGGEQEEQSLYGSFFLRVILSDKDSEKPLLRRIKKPVFDKTGFRERN